VHKPDVLFGSDLGQPAQVQQFVGYVDEISADHIEQVLPALRQVEAAVNAGYYAAGFIGYEAASGLDSSLTTRENAQLPLLWFALYTEYRMITLNDWLACSNYRPFQLAPMQPELLRETYVSSIDAIKDYIAGGDSYQVNLTFRIGSTFSGSPCAFFRDVFLAQPTPYCGFIDMGRYSIVSASPELFFQAEHSRITVKPMKGTAERGRWFAEDTAKKHGLLNNEKERAENLMIVDLLRNDLGRISKNGSVQVTSLFDIETHQTVHQMTSTITSQLEDTVGLGELFQALFPCGSVTGAPKKRSMEIINELETDARGIYTGCIGYIAPRMEKMLFSVAIRTVVLDMFTHKAQLGIGSGVTWDSNAAAEYDECLAKARFANSARAEFKLIESIRFEEGAGYFLFDRHLTRLEQSAQYFGFTLDLQALRRALGEYGQELTGTRKVRILLSRGGTYTIEDSQLAAQPGNAAIVTFARRPVCSENPLLYHKTTLREAYEQEAALHPSYADVIFYNERGEVTEAVNNNIVMRRGRELLTPALESGLLPGTLRGHLLDAGIIAERVITRHELETAEALYLINSVRKWRKVRLLAEGLH
jgi:para-aminobenzoate synthetase / 4-amino-4-deoxychorismate lyase